MAVNHASLTDYAGSSPAAPTALGLKFSNNDFGFLILIKNVGSQMREILLENFEDERFRLTESKAQLVR